MSITTPLKGSPLILIDWGNTLMRDDPTAAGPMCDWPVVEAMPHAADALRHMAAHFPVVLASGASVSNRQQIIQALKRVGLEEWISAVFLASELQSSKASPEFYSRIAAELGVKPEQLAMIGNDLVNDVQNARRAGVHAFWVPEKSDNGNVDEPAYTLREAAEAAVLALG